MTGVAINKRKKSAVSKEIDEIVARDGSVSRKALVKEAQKKGTALHSTFEHAGMFDPKKATLFAQMTFAGYVLRRYQVSVTVDNQEPVTVRALVSLGTDRGKNGYRSTIDVLGDEDQRLELLEGAKRELGAFEHKYAMLSELAPVFEAIKEIG